MPDGSTPCARLIAKSGTVALRWGRDGCQTQTSVLACRGECHLATAASRALRVASRWRWRATLDPLRPSWSCGESPTAPHSGRRSPRRCAAGGPTGASSQACASRLNPSGALRAALTHTPASWLLRERGQAPPVPCARLTPGSPRRRRPNTQLPRGRRTSRGSRPSPSGALRAALTHARTAGRARLREQAEACSPSRWRSPNRPTLEVPR